MLNGSFEWPQPIRGLNAHLESVDRLMLGIVGGGRFGKAAAELINAGGKRIRPALTITAASLDGQTPGQKVVQAAAAVELVHLSSLVHDDIIDKSPRRRQKPSAVSAHGPVFALLLGDFLLAKALSTAATVDEAIALLLAETIAKMAEGEVLELEEGRQPGSLNGSHFEIISKKTAGLFAAASAGGGICVGLPAKEVEALVSYGENFGMAFQLIDDVKDLKIAKSQKIQAVSEIKRRSNLAKQSVQQLKGAARPSLEQLPAAYLDWASPL